MFLTLFVALFVTFFAASFYCSIHRLVDTVAFILLSCRPELLSARTSRWLCPLLTGEPPTHLSGGHRWQTKRFQWYVLRVIEGPVATLGLRLGNPRRGVLGVCSRMSRGGGPGSALGMDIVAMCFLHLVSLPASCCCHWGVPLGAHSGTRHVAPSVLFFNRFSLRH